MSSKQLPVSDMFTKEEARNVMFESDSSSAVVKADLLKVISLQFILLNLYVYI